MSKEIVLSKNAPAPVGPYSQAVLANRLIFTAGQIPLDPVTGQLVQGDIKEQTRRVLENLRGILEEAGSNLDKALKVTIYLKDMNDFAGMNEVYASFFANTSFPARTTVEVSRLPRDARVEIDVIASP